MLVAIPSKNRAGKTKSEKVLTCGVLFVPASEEHQYRKYNSNVVAVPDDVRGITKTRNWILKNCGDPRVVFVDDDVKTHGWTKLYKENSKAKKMTEAEWMKEFDTLFDVTEGIGYKIWGVRTEAMLMGNFPYRPFLFQSYVTASCMGIINDGSYYFDENFPVKEDYEICLRHIKERGGILAARYLHWQNSHWGDEGGCKDYRTQGMEAKCIAMLVKKYPGYIKQIKRGGSEFSISLNF